MSYLPRCATCKHWEPRPDDGVATEGVCALGSSDAGGFNIVAPSGGMWVREYLLTDDTFGCTEHEPTVVSSPRRSIDMAGNPVSEQDTRTLEKRTGHFGTQSDGLGGTFCTPACDHK